MNTILALSCQLAILCAYCALVRGAIQDAWLLREATISSSQQVFQTHYNNQVSLSLNDAEVFHLYAVKDIGNNGRVVNVLNFQIKELISWLDDTIFVITKNESYEVVRMKFVQKREAERLKMFVLEAAPHEEFRRQYYYKILKIAEADRYGRKRNEYAMLDVSKPIYFAVFSAFDGNNDETEKRRFIIHGGSENKIIAVFGRNQFNIKRGRAENRFALIIHSPDNFQEAMFYVLALSCENDQHDNFVTNITEYVSSNIIIPEVFTFLANSF